MRRTHFAYFTILAVLDRGDLPGHYGHLLLRAHLRNKFRKFSETTAFAFARKRKTSKHQETPERPPFLLHFLLGVASDLIPLFAPLLFT